MIKCFDCGWKDLEIECDGELAEKCENDDSEDTETLDMVTIENSF